MRKRRGELIILVVSIKVRGGLSLSMGYIVSFIGTYWGQLVMDNWLIRIIKPYRVFLQRLLNPTKLLTLLMVIFLSTS